MAPVFTPAPPAPAKEEPRALGGYSICSACGAVIEPGKKFCKKCGKQVTVPDLDDMPTIAIMPEIPTPSFEAPAPAPAAPAIPEAEDEDFDICAFCGAAMKVGTKVCTMCGKEMLPLPPAQLVRPAAKTEVCKHCGAKLIPGKRFCTACGKPTGN